MLVLEDSDDEKLYFAKGPPRECVTSGKEIKIQQAPTRWGRVDFDMQAAPEKKNIVSRVTLAKTVSPAEIQVKFRVPREFALTSASVNGRPTSFSGIHGDAVVVQTRTAKNFEIVAEYNQRG